METAMRRGSLAILFAACMLPGCATLRKEERRDGVLTARVRRSGITNASFDGLTLQFAFEFDNASPVRLKVAEIDYWLKVEGGAVARGEAGRGLVIEPKAAASANASCGVKFDELRKGAPALVAERQAAYSLQAIATVVPEQGEPLRFAMRAKGVFPILRVPGIELASLRLGEMSVRAARVSLALRVTNPNVFSTTVKQLQFSVELNGQRVGSIDLTPNTSIARGKATELTVPLALDFRRLGASLHSAMAKGAVEARAWGQGRVMTPYGEPTFPFDAAGRMRVER